MQHISRAVRVCVRPKFQQPLRLPQPNLQSSSHLRFARRPFSNQAPPKIGADLKDASPYSYSVLQSALAEMEKDELRRKARSSEEDAGGPDRSVIEKHLQTGLEFEKTNEFQKAIDYFTKCHEEEPTIPLYLYARSRLYEITSNLTEATKDLERALFFVPGNPTIITQLASLYSAKGESEKAMILLSRLGEKDFSARRLKAVLLQQQGKFQEALEEILPAFPEEDTQNSAPLPQLPTNINISKDRKAPSDLVSQAEAAIMAGDLLMMMGLASYALAYYTRVHQLTLRNLYRSVLTPEQLQQDIASLKLSNVAELLAAPNSPIHSPLFRPHVCSLEGLGQFALSLADWRTAATHFTAALTLLDPHLKTTSTHPSTAWICELAAQIYCKRAVANLNAGNARRSLVDTSVALKLIKENRKADKSTTSSVSLSELMSLLTRGSANALLKEWEDAERDLSRGLEMNQRHPQLAALPVESLVEIRSARLTSTLHLLNKNNNNTNEKMGEVSAKVPTAAELRHLQSRVLDSASGGNNVLNDQQMRILYAFDDAAYLMENGFSVPKELEGLLRNTIRFVLTE